MKSDHYETTYNYEGGIEDAPKNGRDVHIVRMGGRGVGGLQELFGYVFRNMKDIKVIQVENPKDTQPYQEEGGGGKCQDLNRILTARSGEFVVGPF